MEYGSGIMLGIFFFLISKERMVNSGTFMAPNLGKRGELNLIPPHLMGLKNRGIKDIITRI